MLIPFCFSQASASSSVIQGAGLRGLPLCPVILYQAAKSTVKFENHSEHLTKPCSFTHEVTKTQMRGCWCLRVRRSL